MENKEFDCVDMQRKIRQEFWELANQEKSNIDDIIDNELQNSDLYKNFIAKQYKDKRKVA